MKGHLESLSAYAGWLPWPCEESGPTLTVQCGLHLSFRVSGRNRLSFLDRFFLVSEMAFFHQMMKGWCGWLRGPDEGPEFSRCRQDPGHLGRNPCWCPQLCADMMIRKPSRKYSHNHPVPSYHSQSCWRKYPLDLLSEKLSEVSGPPPPHKHLGKDHRLFLYHRNAHD